MTSTLTTHVLDTALGRPAAGVPVRLLTADGTLIAQAATDDDGRIRDLGPADLSAGTYRLHFDVAAYAAATGQQCFFPEVSITFTLTAGADGRVAHHHVPLLLSPFAYSTYRGS